MKVYLYGIQGVYNYGCEAMVRGISEKFKNMYPECNVIYKTLSFENDSKRLSNCNTVELETIESKVFDSKQKNIIYRVIRYIKKKLNIARTDDYIHINTDWTRDCDVLVIIGGDVFDIVPSQKKYNSEKILISKMVKENGGKVILWGISVGSFERDLKAKKLLINYFKNVVDFAAIRDEKSFEYLKSSGVGDNIKLYSDPAYMLRTVQCESDTKEKVLGINLSPLSNRYLKHIKNNDEWICTWAQIVKKIYEELMFDKVLLIPHVVVPSYAKDDDYAYLKKLSEELSDNGVKADFVSDDVGFLGVKNHLIKCSLIMSARMHCAVNAITCGVPTIFLSYSPKSVGMCKHVYGNDKMFFDMNELISNADGVISRLRKISEYTDEIKEYLKNKNMSLYEDACSVAKNIEEFLKAGK